jgi:hypothetical protein
MEALLMALRNGFGVETDIRDCLGQVIVEHDPPLDRLERLELDRLLSCFQEYASPCQTVALNVKSDGLLSLIRPDTLSAMRSSTNMFFFDMSIPETLRYSNAGVPFAQRLSEYEHPDEVGDIPWPTEPSAYWVDGFHSDWFLEKDGWLLKKMSEKAPVVVVSSELHGRDNSSLVECFQESLKEFPEIYICTDKPKEYEIG